MRVRHAFDARRQCNPCCGGSHARSEKRVGRSETGTRPELGRNSTVTTSRGLRTVKFAPKPRKWAGFVDIWQSKPSSATTLANSLVKCLARLTQTGAYGFQTRLGGSTVLSFGSVCQ